MEELKNLKETILAIQKYSQEIVGAKGALKRDKILAQGAVYAYDRVLYYIKEIEQAKEMEKEQSERMYSEEDLKEAFVAGEKHNQWSFSCPSFNEWFEQLKKKSYDQK